MRQRVNYRAERADRDRKKAAKKEARLAARGKPASDDPASSDVADDQGASAADDASDNENPEGS